MFEAKGYFQDAAETAKYPVIRDQLPPNYYLVFVFENPDKSLHFRKVRKDGTKMTMAEWADKNGFRWIVEDQVEGFVNEISS